MDITSPTLNHADRPFSPVGPHASSGRWTPSMYSPTLDEELQLLQQQLEERNAKLREKESEVEHYRRLLEYLKNQLCKANRPGDALATAVYYNCTEMEKKSMKKSVSFVNETQIRFF
jgi:hypothetical protein